MNTNLLIVLLLCAICASPVTCISRWFSATYNDLKFTMYRYGHCDGLSPLNSSQYNETEFLINQIRIFLDQGNYDNEQMANVTGLMDNICRPNVDLSYPISAYVDISKFSNNNTRGKENRCRAIDDAMDSMYYVFKRAALNHSEPLDFSSIVFYANESDKSATYNLSDLINTSWITSEIVLEHVCSITNATKEYVFAKTSNSTAEPRQGVPQGYASSLLEFIDRMIEPLLGLQKRLYWEGTTRLEVFQNRLSSGLGSIRNGIGSGLDSTRKRLFGARTNSTSTSTSTTNSTGTSSGPSGASANRSAVQALNSTSVQTPKGRLNSTSLGLSGRANSMNSSDSMPTSVNVSAFNSTFRPIGY